jgi:hypothetical protein
MSKTMSLKGGIDTYSRNFERYKSNESPEKIIIIIHMKDIIKFING